MLASDFAQHSAGYLHAPYGDVSEGEDETSHTGALNGSRLNSRTPFLQVLWRCVHIDCTLRHLPLEGKCS